MSFLKTKGFKYFKNLVIGVGASLVMLGALGKINSEPWGGQAITIGLLTEAFIFLFLGIIGPEKDYYWDKLYPGLDNYSAKLTPLTSGPVEGKLRPLNAETVENRLGGMLDELQAMSKSLGSLKALQEVDFSDTKNQLESMSNFYQRMNEAMVSLNDAVEDTKVYKEQLTSLNTNLSSLNEVYGGVLTETNQQMSAMNSFYVSLNDVVGRLNEAAEDATSYKEQLASLNSKLTGLNSVYGNVLSAFKQS